MYRKCISDIVFRLSLKSTVSSFFLRQFDKVKDQEYLTILLSLMSGILQTMYGTVYNTIETDIDKSTVLWIRGFLQVATMMCIGKNTPTGCPNKFGIGSEQFTSEASIVYKKVCISFQKIAFSAFFGKLQEMNMDF